MIWSPHARDGFREILRFYRKRNGSNDYGRKVSERLKLKLARYLVFPERGEVMGAENRRYFVCEPFRVCYRFTDTEFEIVEVWDDAVIRMN